MLGSKESAARRRQKVADERAVDSPVTLGTDERKGRHLTSRLFQFVHWLAWPQRLKPTVVQQDGTLPVGVRDELRRELAWLEEWRRQATPDAKIRVVTPCTIRIPRWAGSTEVLEA